MNFKNEKNFIFLSLGIVLIFFLSVTYFFQTEISSQKKVSDQEPSVKRLRFAGVGIILSTTLFIMQLTGARVFLVMASMILTTYMKI